MDILSNNINTNNTSSIKYDAPIVTPDANQVNNQTLAQQNNNQQQKDKVNLTKNIL